MGSSGEVKPHTSSSDEARLIKEETLQTGEEGKGFRSGICLALSLASWVLSNALIYSSVNGLFCIALVLPPTVKL